MQETGSGLFSCKYEIHLGEPEKIAMALLESTTDFSVIASEVINESKNRN